MWYTMENLVGDLLLGLSFITFNSPNTVHIDFVQDRLGELRQGYLGLKGFISAIHYLDGEFTYLFD